MPTEEDTQRAAGVPEPGDILAGKYRVERVVGEGGMGVVVAATHVQLRGRVALKLLKPSVMNPESIARFLREARAAATIKSEHVARVSDVGTLPGGAPYMVMELLEGEDLERAVRERGPMPVASAVDFILQACEAVAEAHALGIVHRDLKPQNLFLARKAGGVRVVKVVDFGISKQLGPDGAPRVEDAVQTQTQSWLGSPYYMSPEQMRSAKDVDARTDLWSLGLILYQLCSARLPFEAPSLAELCSLVLHGPPTPIELWLPDAPAALSATIARCLQKDRDDRYPDVAELARDLAPLASADARGRVERIVSIVQGGRAAQPLASAPPPVDSAEPVLLLRAVKPAAPKPEEPPAPSAQSPKAPQRAQAERTSSAPASVRVPVSERASTPESELADTASAPPEARRRGGARRLLPLLLLLLGFAAAGVVYQRYRTGAWPGAMAVANGAAAVPAKALPATAVPATAAPVPTPSAPAVLTALPEAAPNASAPLSASATTPAASAAGPVASSAPDAGAPGKLAAPSKVPGRRLPASAPEEPSPASPVPPVPAGALKPEVLSEECHMTMPDGTRKQIPCAR